MATFQIDTLTPGPTPGSYLVDFTTVVTVGETERVLPGHTYLFTASDAASLEAQCQAVADHDETELRAKAAPVIPADISALLGG
jgi:hypothetical protein